MISPEVASWIERELDPKNRIAIPRTVNEYHPLVRSAKIGLEQLENYRFDDPWRSSGRDGVFIRVTKRLVGPACRVMHALLTGFEKRGFRIHRSREHNEMVVNILGEEFKFSLTEHLKRVKHIPTKGEIDRERRDLATHRKFDDVPSGRLRFQFDSGEHHRGFDSDDFAIDRHLNEVVLALVRTVIEVIRPEKERRAKEEEVRRERERQRWIYQQKCDRFDDAYRAWAGQQERLRFLLAVEEALGKLPDPADSVEEYVAWARRYVESADPLSKFFDSIENDKLVYYHEFTRQRFGL